MARAPFCRERVRRGAESREIDAASPLAGALVPPLVFTTGRTNARTLSSSTTRRPRPAARRVLTFRFGRLSRRRALSVSRRGPLALSREFAPGELTYPAPRSSAGGPGNSRVAARPPPPVSGPVFPASLVVAWPDRFDEKSGRPPPESPRSPEPVPGGSQCPRRANCFQRLRAN